MLVIAGQSRSKNGVALLAYDPAIHLSKQEKKMDAQIKSGHDESSFSCQ